MPTLVSVGLSGRLGGLGRDTGATSGTSLSYIPVVNAAGTTVGCPYYVLNASGVYYWVLRWVHTASGGHVLIDPIYTPLTLDIVNAAGTQLGYTEPIEVYSNGTDFYISQYCFNKNIIGFKVIK